MPVRVDLVYDDSSTIDWSESIACPKCRKQWKASVRSSGTGTGTASYGLGRQSARDRAGMESFIKATEEGERLIRRAKCPACGHRQSAALSLLGVGGGFIVGMIAASLGGLLPVALAFLGCLAGPAAWFAVARWDQRRNRREADARVVFQPLP